MVNAIISVVFQLIGYFINKSKMSKEAKEKYFQFVLKAGGDMGSVKLRKYGKRHIEYLKKTPWKESR